MKKYETMIRIHYGGDIAENHQIPMRILGKAIVHLQNSIDRAYLDIKHNGIWKYARMAPEDYVKTEYLVQEPKEGGYILDFFSKAKDAKKIINRVTSAIDQVVQQTIIERISIKKQVELRKKQIMYNDIDIVEFDELLDNPSEDIVRKYGDRSIAKEIDQVLATIRQDYAGNSTFELLLTGEETKSYFFDRTNSIKFHGIVSKRNLGNPVVYTGFMDEISIKNKKAKFINIKTGKTSIVHISNKEDLLKIHPYVVPEKKIKFVGCPLIEFGALEPYSGDIYFIDLLEENDGEDAQQSH